MKKLLVCGFGPFGPFKQNVSEMIVKQCNNHTLASYLIYGRTFEVTIPFGDKGVDTLVTAKNSGCKRVVIIDMNPRVHHVTIETTAHNLISDPEFASYVQYYKDPEKPIVNIGDPADNTIFCNLEPWNIKGFRVECLNRGLQTRMSTINTSPWSNYIMYQIARASMEKELQGIPWIVLSVPCSPTIAGGIGQAVRSLPFMDTMNALTILIEKMIEVPIKKIWQPPK